MHRKPALSQRTRTWRLQRARRSVLLILAAPILLVPVVLVPAVSGCATTEKAEAKLQTWVGRDVDDLTASMGPPNSSIDLSNGGRQLEWSRVFSLSAPGQVDSSQPGSLPSRATYTRDIGRTATYSCDTTALIDQDGRIMSIQREGNGCEGN